MTSDQPAERTEQLPVSGSTVFIFASSGVAFWTAFNGVTIANPVSVMLLGRDGTWEAPTVFFIAIVLFVLASSMLYLEVTADVHRDW